MAAGRSKGAPAACSGLATNSKVKAMSPLAARAIGDSTWNRASNISGNAATCFSELLVWRAGLDTNPPIGLTCPREEGRRILTRSGRARMRLLGHRGIGVDPPG